MKIFVVLLSLLVACMGQIVSVYDDELAVEVDKQVNTEINFDQVLQSNNLTSFRALLIKAKLFARLNVTNTSFTVFAPTNAAIMNAPKPLLENATRLPEVLLYHVHLGAFRTNMIERDMRLKTLLGGQKKIRFERYNGVFYGSCQQFGKIKDLTYNNGILDTLNGVMVPPEGNLYDILSKTSTFSSFLKYVNMNPERTIKNLLQKGDRITLLAPNDDAFGKLPKDVVEKLNQDYKFLSDVLQYHVLEEIICLAGFENGSVPTFEGSDITVAVSGKKVVFNSNATLIQPDTIAYNGVLHVIDTVLLPPQLN